MPLSATSSPFARIKHALNQIRVAVGRRRKPPAEKECAGTPTAFRKRKNPSCREHKAALLARLLQFGGRDPFAAVRLGRRWPQRVCPRPPRRALGRCHW